MLILLAALTLSATAVSDAQRPHARPRHGCVRANAAQLFALADKLYEAGDYCRRGRSPRSADPGRSSRASRRSSFSIGGAARENRRPGRRCARPFATSSPSSRMPTRRGSSSRGSSPGWARTTTRASRSRSPSEAASRPRSSRAFAGSPPQFRPMKRRGLSLEMTGGPDSNINRSTSSQYVDTIIAPFELDPDARRQSGIGFSAAAVRRSPATTSAGVDLLVARGRSRGPVHQAAVQRCPADLRQRARMERRDRATAARPLLYERRWYGGNPYSTGFGASLDWLKQIGPGTQLELSGSRGAPEHPAQSGAGRVAHVASAPTLRTRSAADSTARLSLRFAALDARRPSGKPAADGRGSAACEAARGRHGLCRFRLYPDARARASVPVRQDPPRLAHRPHRRD